MNAACHIITTSYGHSQKDTMFSANKYRAIDYVFEVSARHRLTMNWLVLPIPYHLGTIYPHTGNIPEVTYRKPWMRGNVISTCRLHVSGSVLEDLRAQIYPMDSLEKIGVSVTQMRGDPLEVVPSSNPASQACLETDEALWVLCEGGKESPCLPLDEVFSKATGETSCLSHDDLFMPEEIIFNDNLQQFKRHLPLLRTKLRRLKTLTVPDPLLSSTGDSLSDNIIFRHCASFDATSDRDTESSESVSNFIEEISKESVLDEESLMLPVEVETSIIQKQHSTISLANLPGSLNIIAEPMGDQTSLMDILKKATPAGKQEISEFKMPSMSVSDMDNLISLDPQSPVSCRLYPEMETDLLLTPPQKPLLTQLCLSSTGLPAEQLSPIYRHRLVLDNEREDMEQALWMAEKHPHFVASFLLAEPRISEPTAQSQPLSKALRLLGLECESSVSVREGQEQSRLLARAAEWTKTLVGGDTVFTESMITKHINIAKAETVQTEDFSLLSVIQIDDILRESTEDVEQPVTPSETKVSSIPRSVSQRAIPTHQENGKAVKVIIVEEAIHKGKPLPDVRQEKKVDSPCKKEKEALKLAAPRPPKDCQRSSSLSKTQADTDPLSTFMMLRTQQKATANAPHQNSPRASEFQNVEQKSTEEVGSGVNLNSMFVSPDRGNDDVAQETSCQKEDRHISKVIHVQATGSQCQAYRELRALALPCLSRARELGLSARTCVDFSTLTPEQTRFFLKQQEKELSMRQGQETLYNEVALMHILVTVKELLLKCDLSTAVDYLVKAEGAHTMSSLSQLVKKLRVLQYLSQKNKEPNPKPSELQEQMRTWLQTNRTQNSKVLVVITMDSDCVRSLLIRSLSQVAGAILAAVLPEENSSKVDSKRVMESLRCSGCLVICSQHIGADFPWHCFSLVVEYDNVEHFPWTAVCRERDISHMAFCTAIPSSETDPADISTTLPYLENIPFVLFVTEGLLNRSSLLQTLESTYNLTLFERSHSQSLQMLGGTHQYAVITVDESTSVLIQELDELGLERASESVVMRLTALSLQYSSCWLILHWATGHNSGLTSEVFNNLVLIYSAFVLFGLKCEDLDVKVLIVSEEADIARCIYQIAYYTLMSSERDPLTWLDREWLSVLLSEEEKCLLCFPCVNPLVAQLMLRRGPSLQWLLRSSLPELQGLFPEVPHKVTKLFSDTTALYALSAAPSMPELTLQQPSSPSTPWASSREYTQHEPVTFHSNQHHEPEAFDSNQHHEPVAFHSNQHHEPVAFHSNQHHEPVAFHSNQHHEPVAFHCTQDPLFTGSPCAGDTEGYLHQEGPVMSAGFGADFSQAFGSVVPLQGLQQSPWEVEDTEEERFPGQNRRGAEWVRRPSLQEPARSFRDTHSLSPFHGGSSVRHSNQPQISPYPNDQHNNQLQISPYSNDQPQISPYSSHRHSNQPQMSPYPNNQACAFLRSSYHPLTSPTGPQWGARVSPCRYSEQAGGFTSPDYGTSFRTGLERKRRSGDTGGENTFAGLPQLKKGKLLYEKVPGRSDGQTRLRFF